MNYVELASLMIVSDELLLEACTSGDVCAVRILLTHQSADPTATLNTCIRHCVSDVLVAIVEDRRTRVTDEHLLLACILARDRAITLLLKDARYNPSGVLLKCISSITQHSEPLESLCALLSPRRLSAHLEGALLFLVSSGVSAALFCALIERVPCSSTELLSELIARPEHLEGALACSSLDNTKEFISLCLIAPSRVLVLELVLASSQREEPSFSSVLSGSQVRTELLSGSQQEGHRSIYILVNSQVRKSELLAEYMLLQSIRADDCEVVTLALQYLPDPICAGRKESCPLGLSLEQGNEELSVLLSGSHREEYRSFSMLSMLPRRTSSCCHLRENCLIAVRLGYISVIECLLPSLLESGLTHLDIADAILLMNRENATLALLQSGYRVTHATLCLCLERRLYTSVSVIRAHQDCDLSHNNYELLRIASRDATGAAFRSLRPL